MTCTDMDALYNVRNEENTQHLRFLVIFQYSVGVEGGSIIHLLHIRTWLLTLREKKHYNIPSVRSKLSHRLIVKTSIFSRFATI